MPLFLDNPVTERAQPWLGTFVNIRVSGLAPLEAHRVIDAAFEEIATVHGCMSFHDPESDIGRLNRYGLFRSIEVHPYTYDVLQRAQEIAALSEGCFDVSIGAELVEWEFLPKPTEISVLLDGCWRDIALLPGNRVQLHKPLWIDLGGIAKGYAVDRAIARLREYGADSAVVNAGGDLRVLGQQVEQIALELETATDTIPVLELADGSVASSSGHRERRYYRGLLRGPHLHGAQRSSASTQRFVCVVAKECIIADALTKVVMAEGVQSLDLLRQFSASAHLHDPDEGWLHLNEGAA